MRNFYSLFALGALLFAACSENASPISGSTSVPNMGEKSPVLCSVMGVTDSLEAIEKGCIWSPEMWGRTSGYRVRTGFDNGTNTSGIWTWHTEGNVRFEWPGVATDEYDSMALADVIDKCGGSLCGKVVNEPNEIKDDSAAAHVESSAYVEFYFAGMDSLGNIGEVDARAMNGICLEYSGNLSIELIPNDSIANLNKLSSYSVDIPIPYLWDLDESLPKIKEECFPGWFGFRLVVPDLSDSLTAFKIEAVPVEVVAAHLKGLRFKFHYNETNTEFNIVGIDWYIRDDSPTTNLHPVEETCEPVAVSVTFCDCEFSEELAVSNVRGKNYFYFIDLLRQMRKDSVQISDASEKCLYSTLDSLKALLEINLGSAIFPPCDNPLPQSILCSDGRRSLSIEYQEKYAEFYNKIEGPLEVKAYATADSLFNYCMSLNK